MPDDVLAEVKRLKKEATLLRTIGDTDGAIAILDEAIALVKAARGGSSSSDESGRLKAQLADCYGMKGGVYRRAGRMTEALDAYKTGLKFETDDSYNLTNSLTVELLIDPTRLKELTPAIEAARDKVETQIRLHRSGQWWAWADLGLLELLTRHEERAFDAYKNFGATGARASDYDSTISVLEELSGKFTGNNEAVRASLDHAVDLLKRLKP